MLTQLGMQTCSQVTITIDNFEAPFSTKDVDLVEVFFRVDCQLRLSLPVWSLTWLEQLQSKWTQPVIESVKKTRKGRKLVGKDHMHSTVIPSKKIHPDDKAWTSLVIVSTQTGARGNTWGP